MQQFLNPDVGQASVQTATALGRKLPARKRTIPPRQVTLTVLNGNGIAGSAGNASYLLGQKGYSTVTPPSGQPANAPNWNYFHSKVYFDPARKEDGQVAAEQVARLVGSADVEPMPANIRPLANGALLTVIVGSTFHGDLAPVVIPTTPTRQPPNVRRDPGATRSTLFRVRKRLPFTVEYPTLLESSSNLDDGYGETPVRIYPLGGTADAAADVPQGAASSTGASRRRTGPTRRCSTTRASRSGSAGASSTSTTPARTCTWSCCATTARPTGS